MGYPQSVRKSVLTEWGVGFFIASFTLRGRILVRDDALL